MGNVVFSLWGSDWLLLKIKKEMHNSHPMSLIE